MSSCAVLLEIVCSGAVMLSGYVHGLRVELGPGSVCGGLGLRLVTWGLAYLMGPNQAYVEGLRFCDVWGSWLGLTLTDLAVLP